MAILIKNGVVYDGSDRPPEKKDIIIAGNRIARLGTFSKSSAGEIIDATGAIVVPGFIDINTDSDHHLSLFSEPYQEDFLRQGITTEIGGNCGVSLAPLLNGSLDAVIPWSGVASINVNWRSLKEFWKALEQRGNLGINFGTLIGHTTIRQALTTENRDLTEQELEILKKTVVLSLNEGGFGVSLGLNYLGAAGVPYRELEELARIAKQKNCVFAVHLRDDQKNLAAAVWEVLNLAASTHLNLEINHFQPISGFSELYLKALDLIEEASLQERINFDVYPFLERALPVYKFLPSWLKIKNLKDANQEIRSPHLKERILESLAAFRPQDMVIGRTPKHLKFLEGKTMEQFTLSQNLKWPESFLKFMHLTHLDAIIFYKNIDETLLEKFMVCPQAIVSSNGASLPEDSFKHQRNLETFPKFLQWVKEKKLMPLERAISKITSLPAAKYKIAKRGLIKEGYYADLLVLKDYLPSYVLVNGRVAVKDGKCQKILAGAILKAKHA